jgi:hypothetical protein
MYYKVVITRFYVAFSFTPAAVEQYDGRYDGPLGTSLEIRACECCRCWMVGLVRRKYAEHKYVGDAPLHHGR